MKNFRIQHIDRNSYKELIDNSHLIDEFKRLCEGFKFVYLWDDPGITPEMCQMYARNVPAKETSGNFIYSVERLYSKININQRKSIYL